MKICSRKAVARLWMMLLFVGLGTAMISNIATAVAVGEKYGGGVVFFVDPTGQHGLVAAEADIAAEADWHDANELCRSSFTNGYAGWYLPSRGELNQLYQSRLAVGGFADTFYWSGSEFSNSSAWLLLFGGTGGQYVNDKTNGYGVRAIRAF